MTGHPIDDRLSRFLDDDLASRERDAVERRIASDPQYRSELAAMRVLRQAIAAVAEAMEPPPELDALLEPLRRNGRTQAGRPHRTVRWIAVAAALCLAVVAFEFVRHDDTQQPTSLAALRERPPQQGRKRGVYQLRPLPTSALSSEAQPLGVTDRLLATPLPHPRLDDPTPLAVVGPLAAPPSSAQRRVTAATLIVTGPEETVSTRLPLQVALPAGRYAIVIVIDGGVISEVHGAEPGVPVERLAEALTEIRVSGLADGRHDAQLAVEQSP